MEERSSRLFRRADERLYSVRAATWGDLDAVTGLSVAYDVVDFGEPDFQGEFVADQWRLVGDLAPNTWVVEDADGRVVGYGEVEIPRGEEIVHSYGIVHPDQWGRGIGALVLDRIEARVAEIARKRRRPVPHHASVTTTDQRAQALLEQRGYRVVRRYFFMQIDLGPNVVFALDSPAGVAIRRFRPGEDDRAVHKATTRGFEREWGFVPEPFEDWRKRKFETAPFDPELWFVAEADGEVVGTVQGRVRDGRGRIDALAVLEAWRGRGIAPALLRHAFDAFNRKGLPLVMLSVDSENPTGATRVYERAGMRVRRSWQVYEKMFDPTG